MSRGWSVWVEPSGNGWRTRWKGVHGSGQRTFAHYKKDAQELAEAKRQAWQRADAGLSPLPVAAVGPDFPSFRKEYLAFLSAKRSESTHRITDYAIKHWVEFAGERFPVSRKMKATDGGHTVDDFCAWLIGEKGKAVNGALIDLRHLKAAFRWALKFDLIDYDPFLHFEMPPKVNVARLMKPDELAAIFADMSDVCRRAFIFKLFTGLRLGELESLEWSAISQSAAGVWYLTVMKSKTRRAIPETKTQALHPSAMAVLGPHGGQGRVFDVSRSHLQHSIRKAVARQGMGRVRPHDLRHTFATHLMQEAKDLPAVMAVGGWATAKAAMLYQHQTDERRDVTLKMRLELPELPLPSPIKKGPEVKPETKSSKKASKKQTNSH